MTSRHQGVLWKRRDVFKYRWRPRWFVLHPEQGVLTYYLLTAQVATDGAMAASPLMPSTSTNANATTSSNALRPRTFSHDSQVSENTVDYDVVPRGTLDLRGCAVKANDRLSKPEQHFFAFTITAASSTTSTTATSSSSAPSIHLATRTQASRRIWMERIQRVAARHERTTRAAGLGEIPSIVNTSAPPLNEMDEHFHDSEMHTETVSSEAVPPIATTTTTTTPTPSTSSSDRTWRPVGADHVLYEHLAPALTQQLVAKRQRFLPVLEEDPARPEHGWTPLVVRGDEYVAYQKEIPLLTPDATRSSSTTAPLSSVKNSLTLLKSIALLPHPPRQLLNLLLDATRRGHFETNLQTEERLARLNAHTVLDYYSYEPVWPLSAREFAVATHWQVLQRGSGGVTAEGLSSDRALLLWAFSCPEADHLRPPTEPRRNVRADLIISMVLLRPVGDAQCHYTRLLCFDPKIGFPQQRLNSYITAQQAGQPAVLSRYLQQHEPIPSSRMYGPLEEDVIIRDIVNHLPESSALQPRRIDFRRNYSRTNSSPLLGDEDMDENSQLAATTLKTEVSGPPALETQATFLLAPTLIYRILDSFHVSSALLVFCLLAFWAIRQVVMLHLGEMLPERVDSPLVGPITCRFTVDLKGAMRFVNNKKEEREELGQGTAEVTIVHLVASALARALKEVPCLHRRRVVVPWLFIDHVVDAAEEPVSVSISENDGGWVTLEHVDRIGVQALSDAALEADRKLDAAQIIGQCLVVAPPPADSGPGHYASQIEIHASPLLQAGVLVVAVLGQVRVEKGPKSPSSAKRPPRSVIDVFLTLKSPSEGDFGSCRRYAEEVQKLLSFPEMLG